MKIIEVRSQRAEVREQPYSLGKLFTHWGWCLFSVFILTSVFWFCPTTALAQCPMCKAAAASQQAQAIRSLNIGIVVILVPSLLAFAGVFAVALRLKNPHHKDE